MRSSKWTRRAVVQVLICAVGVGTAYADAPAAQRAEIVKAIDTPNRIIIKVNPIKIWHWDLGKMAGVR